MDKVPELIKQLLKANFRFKMNSDSFPYFPAYVKYK